MCPQGGWTALHLAVGCGRDGAAELLLAAGSDAKALNDAGMNPAQFAAGCGQSGRVAQLLLPSSVSRLLQQQHTLLESARKRHKEAPAAQTEGAATPNKWVPAAAPDTPSPPEPAPAIAKQLQL